MGDVELSFDLFGYNVEGLPPFEPVGGSHGNKNGLSGVDGWMCPVRVDDG